MTVQPTCEGWCRAASLPDCSVPPQHKPFLTLEMQYCYRACSIQGLLHTGFVAYRVCGIQAFQQGLLICTSTRLGKGSQTRMAGHDLARPHIISALWCRAVALTNWSSRLRARLLVQSSVLVTDKVVASKTVDAALSRGRLKCSITQVLPCGAGHHR